MRATAIRRGAWPGVRIVLIGLVAALGAVVLSACSRSGRISRTGPIRIVVSIAPLKGIADEVVKDIGSNASVELLVPVGAMEHGYEIPPSMIVKLIEADVVLYVGLNQEPQIERILKEQPLAERRVVCFADVVGVKADDHAHHHHGDDDHDHGHDHSGADPHLWLDPSMVHTYVEKVASAVAQVASERGFDDAPSRIASAAERFRGSVSEIDAAYEERLRPFQGSTIITAHAAWGRLTDRYGLEQAALAGLEASEPSPDAIARAAALIREKKAGALFSEPQISRAAVDRIASLTGARVFELDPLGDGDWIKMMETNLDALVAGLSTK